MEKEQHQKTFEAGEYNCLKAVALDFEPKSFETYFLETYGNK
jgi:hypothetical protein